MSTKSTKIQRDFGKKMRSLRSKHGLSQEKLGFDTGLDRTYISGIERGQRNPSLKNIGKIAKALKTSLQDLFNF